jgi:hypothetical protein
MLNHYNGLDSTESKPLTPTEAYIRAVYGELHVVIPELASRMTLQEVATELSNKGFVVSRQWVSHWLRENGYRKVYRRIERTQGGAA